MILDMSLKIREEVKMKFDASFLVETNTLNKLFIFLQSRRKMEKYECVLTIET